MAGTGPGDCEYCNCFPSPSPDWGRPATAAAGPVRAAWVSLGLETFGARRDRQGRNLALNNADFGGPAFSYGVNGCSLGISLLAPKQKTHLLF